MYLVTVNQSCVVREVSRQAGGGGGTFLYDVIPHIINSQ